MTTTRVPHIHPTTALAPRGGDRTAPSIRVRGASSRVGEETILQPTTFSVHPGQLVGIAGGSGAGKTTLLEIMAGLRPPSTGHVARADAQPAFVPQDDIIHRDLPLGRTLEHSAALRLPGVDRAGRAAAVDSVLRRLDLAGRADVTVSDLSGGQRKRASLAAEMLTDPQTLFLDEPTSGLDPANAAELLSSLRRLAVGGSTVVIATHSPADLVRCDRIVFVARGGHVAFVGSPEEALRFFGVDEIVDVYSLLDTAPTGGWAAPSTDGSPANEGHAAPADRPPRRPGATMQWLALSRRNLDLVRGNKLTLAILLGSPVFIIAMMTMLFPSGAFDTDAASSAMAVQTLFWLAFNSFFFGLTSGLLQVVGEFEIVRRERRMGLHLGAYVASKMAILVPLLAVVNAAQLVAMQLAGRLPSTSIGETLAVFLSLQLLSTAAVGIGLHASSAVHNAAQATLALPMLCFPQVLFAGAVVPVSEMGWFPQLMSVPLASRWGFESLGRTLGLGPAASGEAGTAGFASAFTGSAVTGWAILGLLILLSIVGTVRTLQRRTAV